MALLICDDDIYYKKKFLTTIYNEYIKDTKNIYTYNIELIEGWKGYMIKKSVIKPILKFKRPPSCFRVDDDFISEIVNILDIPIKVVDRHDDPFYSDKAVLVMSKGHDNDTRGTNWSELKEDEYSGKRPELAKKCKGDIYALNKLRIKIKNNYF